MFLFHFQASHTIGTGHARRCSVLAQELSQQDYPISVISDETSWSIAHAFFPIDTHFIPLTDKGLKDTLESLGALSEKTLIIDSYSIDRQFTLEIGTKLNNIIRLEDYPPSDIHTDFLLDQNPSHSPEDWRKFLPKNSVPLSGTSYALLRPEFRALRLKKENKQHEGILKNIFICFGGFDTTGITYNTCETVIETLSSTTSIHIALGDNSKHLDRLKDLCDATSNAYLYVNCDKIGQLMNEADLAIGAPGSMTFERCCVGLPSILISIADNQIENGVVSQKFGIAEYLGTISHDTMPTLTKTLRSFVQNPAKLTAMQIKAHQQCDGLGVKRVVNSILPVMSKHNAPIYLRPYEIGDIATVLTWQNTDGVRQYSKNQAKISEADHLNWSKNKIENAFLDTYIAVDQATNTSVGFVHLKPFRDPNMYISILVSPNTQGQGIATAILKLVNNIYPDVDLYAEIHENNLASIRIFENTGYVKSKDNYYIRYKTKEAQYV